MEKYWAYTRGSVKTKQVYYNTSYKILSNLVNPRSNLLAKKTNKQALKNNMTSRNILENKTA